jgi:hypothetical protein
MLIVSGICVHGQRVKSVCREWTLSIIVCMLGLGDLRGREARYLRPTQRPSALWAPAKTNLERVSVVGFE